MAATLIIKSISANPVKVHFMLGGYDGEIEWPNKGAAINSLQQAIQPEANWDLALALVLLKWSQTDPNLNNVSQLVGKTITISNPVVTIV